MKTRVVRQLVLLLIGGFSMGVQAELYKCPQDGGGYIYRSDRCEGALLLRGQDWVSADEVERHQRAEADARKAKAAAAREARVLRREQIISDAMFAGGWAVEYLVEGSAGRASLTYRNRTGGTEQQDVTLPWRRMFAVPMDYFAYISAQNAGERGCVTARVLINDRETYTSQSCADFGIATASGGWRSK